MTEEKLSQSTEKPANRRWIRLIGAALFLFVALLALFRQPIAEAIAGSICGQQSLTCKLKITRLDFGGVTVRGIDVRGPESRNAALSASTLVVDFNWTSPFSFTAKSVAGDDIVVRLDLSGTRPLLGDLDKAVASFTKPGGKPGPMPQLDFKTLRVIGDTPLGPVEARGKIAATGPNAFVVELNAPAARLGLFEAELQLNGASLNANVSGKEIKGRANVDLEDFKFRGSIISDLKADVSLDQSAGVLRGEGAASMGKVSLRDTDLSGAQAKASVESAEIDPAAFDLSAWLANVRRLSLNATAGEGVIGDAGWSAGVLTAEIGPRDTGGAGGDISFTAEKVRLAQGAAARVELIGKVDIPKQGETRAQGVARLLGGSLTASHRRELGAVLADPFEAALPVFGQAARRAADRAGSSFEITLPWAAKATNDGIDIAALTGSTLRAASGLVLALDALPGSQSVVGWNTEAGGRWSAAGAMRLSGGGGPDMTVDLARATGAKQTVSMAGAVRLKSWRVADDALSAEATGLEFDTSEKGGSAAGQFSVRLDGGLAGGVWKAARATGQIKSAWAADSFYADAPRGLVIQWDEGRYGDTRFGASALHFTPTGRLAELADGAVVGKGTLARVSMPVRGGGYTANASIGETAINWRAQGGVRAGFDAAPSTIDLKFGERSAPMRIQDIAGVFDIRQGWRVNGTLRGGEAKIDEANLADVAAKFDLGGAGGAIDGKLSDVKMRIFDPLLKDGRRYEDMTFEGAANLRDSVANFSGVFTSVGKGVQIASVTGAHSLKTGAGSLEFAPTPLIFRPRSFQPYDLSPFLRGPASVTGRADVAGNADWDADHFKARASIDLRNVGFTLAAVGTFEGVSGKVAISDLLKMESEPGQTITVEKITLGMPIEKGTIKFRLIGFDAIRLENAEWPFVGGFIRIRPIDFKFDEASNRVIAQAVNWDLNKIVELFKIPDVKIDGIVNGDIPVAFSTGSARIDKAKLAATEKGGTIQYSGSTGDAAAQTDANAKMLFDALKDFRYRVLEMRIDGDIAGRLVLSMTLLGRNPDLLAGSEFKLGISIDSALMELLHNTQGAAQDLSGRINGSVIRPN